MKTRFFRLHSHGSYAPKHAFAVEMRWRGDIKQEPFSRFHAFRCGHKECV